MPFHDKETAATVGVITGLFVMGITCVAWIGLVSWYGERPDDSLKLALAAVIGAMTGIAGKITLEGRGNATGPQVPPKP